jgi:hypothetical protein
VAPGKEVRYVRGRRTVDAKLSARILVFLLGATVLGCSKQPVIREQLPDGSYSFKCEEPLFVCLSRVDEVCQGGPYEVAGAWDQPNTTGVDENRVESRKSQAIVRCLRKGEDPVRRFAKPLASPIDVQPAQQSAGAASAAPPPSVPARVCVPGTTQACVGVGACSGGQACSPDGSGFGPCECS